MPRFLTASIIHGTKKFSKPGLAVVLSLGLILHIIVATAVLFILPATEAHAAPTSCQFQTIWSVSSASKVQEHKAGTMAPTTRLPFTVANNYNADIAVSPDNKFIFVNNQQGSIEIWSASGTRLHVMNPVYTGVNIANFVALSYGYSPSGNPVLLIGSSTQSGIYSVPVPSSLATMTGNPATTSTPNATLIVPNGITEDGSEINYTGDFITLPSGDFIAFSGAKVRYFTKAGSSYTQKVVGTLIKSSGSSIPALGGTYANGSIYVGSGNYIYRFDTIPTSSGTNATTYTVASEYPYPNYEQVYGIGGAQDANADCASLSVDIQNNTAPTITPAVAPLNTEGKYTATYTVKAVNTSTTAPATFSTVLDKLSFGSDVTVTQTSWTGATTGSAAGAGPYTLNSTTRSIPAGQSATWTVTVSFTKNLDLSSSACAGVGTGLYSIAEMPTGSEGSTLTNNYACSATPLAAPTMNSPTMVRTTTPILSGQAVANQTITIKSSSGATVGSAIADSAGKWSYQVPGSAALSQGSNTFYIAQSGSAGTVSPDRQITITVDSVAPNSPVITSPIQGLVTKQDVKTISGTGEVGATILVSVNGIPKTCANALVAANGTWECQLSGSEIISSSGAYTISATQRDPAGNISTATNISVTIDKDSPPVPIVTSPAPGLVSKENVTSFSGTGEAGATITTIQLDGVNVGCSNAPITVDLSGKWSCTLATNISAEGNHTVAIKQRDTAGNESPVGSSTFTIDKTAPNAPIISSPINGQVLSAKVTSLSGSGETGSIITTVLVDNQAATCLNAPIKVAADKSWTCNLATDISAEGNHTVSVAQTDAAGNESAAASSIFTLDTTPPAAPVIASPGNDANLSSNVTSLSGTGESEATISFVVVDGGTISCTNAPVKVAADKSWTCALPNAITAEQSHTVAVKQTDPAGNTSLAGTSTFIIDKTIPDVPVIGYPADGARINFAVSRLTGTGEPAAIISSVTVDGSPVSCSSNPVVQPDGSWVCDLPSMINTEGSHTVMVKQTDHAGNTSVAASNTFTIDFTAPDAPVISSPANGLLTNNAISEISGTGEADASISLLTLDGVAVTCANTPVKVSSAKTWSCTLATPISQEKQDHSGYVVEVKQTDAANNTSGPGSTNFTIDITAPAMPSFSSPSTPGMLTNNNRLGISGKAEVGTTVTLSGFPGDTTCIPTPNPIQAEGGWSCVPSKELSDGSYTLIVTSTDKAGNATSANTWFQVDATAPPAPVITSPSSDSFTSDNTPTVAGTGEVGATITLAGLPSGATCSPSPIMVKADGTWSCDLSVVSDGAFTMKATATDVAGNVSASASAEVKVTVDTQAPLAPGIVSPANGALLKDPVPTIAGSGENGAIVSAITVDGTLVTCSNAPVAVASGVWSCTLPVSIGSDGSHTVTAVQTDQAGNSSPAATSTFMLDVVAPAAPVVTVPVKGSFTNADVNIIAGTGEIGATITGLKINDGAVSCKAAVTVSSDGNWSCELSTPLSADTLYKVSVQQQDPAGNTSPAATTEFTVDKTKPAAPIMIKPTDEVKINSNEPVISGTAETGTTITITGLPEGTSCVPSPVIVKSDGTWSCEPSAPLPDGNYTFAATATDAAGNVSVASASHTFTVDTKAPPAPTFAFPVNESTISDNKPTVTGKAESGDTITVSNLPLGVTCGLSPITANNDGVWSCTPSATLPDGTRTWYATATDAAGNVSETATVRFTVDTTPPVAPTILLPADSSGVATLRPSISGTAEPGSTIELSGLPSETSCKPTPIKADDQGNWSCTPDADLPQGAISVTATATDVAGNTSPSSYQVTFVVDVTKPDPVKVSAPANNAFINSDVATISGTGEPGATISKMIIKPATGAEEHITCSNAPVQVSAEGNWSCTLPTPITAAQNYSVLAAQTDKAGNASADVTSSFTIDKTAPNLPKITAPTDQAILSVAQPQFSGTAEPGAIILGSGLPAGVQCLPFPEANNDGHWSCTVNKTLPDGPYNLTVVAADKAGNISQPVNLKIVIDNTKPAIQSIPNQTVAVNNPLDIQVQATDANGPLHYAATGLPAGMSIDQTTGKISGAPTAAGTFTVTVLVSDNATIVANSDQISFTITVLAATTISVPATTTTNNLLPISGTGAPDATVTVTANKAAVNCQNAPVVVSSNGAWVCTPTVALPDGELVVQASASLNEVSAAPAQTTVTINPPSISLSGTPVISNAQVTVKAGESVTITAAGADDNVPLGFSQTGMPAGMTVTDGKMSGIPNSPGVYHVTFTVKDNFGNLSTASVTINVLAKPTITFPTAGAEITNAYPVISGQGTEGADLMVVKVGDITICEAKVRLDKTWQCQPTTPLVSGQTYTLTATQSMNGVTSDPSDPMTFKMAALVIQAVKVVVKVNQEIPANNAIASGGSDPEKYQMEVQWHPLNHPEGPGAGYQPDGTNPNAPIGANFVPNTPYPGTNIPNDLTNGKIMAHMAGSIAQAGYYPATVTLIDTGNNSKAVTKTGIYVLGDPTITSPAQGSETTQNLPTLSGAGTPKSTVTIKTGTTTVCSAQVSLAGEWSCSANSPLPQGAVALKATASYEGVTSNEITQAFTITAPMIAADSATVNVSALVDIPVTMTDLDGIATRAATGLPAGAEFKDTEAAGWKITGTPSKAGVYPVTIDVTDTYGNSGTKEIVITVNGAPKITSPVSASTTMDNKPTITGTGVPGATITVASPQVTGEVCDAPIAVKADGSWSCTLKAAFALTSNSGVSVATSIMLTAKSAFGPLEQTSAETTFTINPPTLTLPNQTINAGEQVSIQAASTDPNTPLTYSVPSEHPLPAGLALNSDGLITGSPTGTASSYLIYVQVKDSADSISVASSTLSVQKVPTIALAAGTLASDNTPGLVGTGTVGAKIMVVDSKGAQVCTADVIQDPAQPVGEGKWECAAATQTVDLHSYTASSTLYGVTSAASQPLAVTIVLPELSVTGQTVKVGTAVKVQATSTDPDGPLKFTTTSTLPDGLTMDSQGAITSTTSLAAGVYPINVTVTDIYGNSSTQAITITVLAAPTITSPVTGSTTHDNVPTVAGAGTPGATVTVKTSNDQLVCSAVISPAGNWRCAADDDHKLTDGSVELKAISATLDPATNQNVESSTAVNTTVEIKPPALGISFKTVNLNNELIIKATSDDPNQPLKFSISTLEGENESTNGAGVLPLGVSLNPDTGEIKGVPTEAGRFQYRLRVKDRFDNSTTVDKSITVQATAVITAPAEATLDNIPKIKGTATPLRSKLAMNDAKIIVMDFSGEGTEQTSSVLCTAEVSFDGNWECVPARPLNNGVHTLKAKSIIFEQNAPLSESFNITINDPDLTIARTDSNDSSNSVTNDQTVATVRSGAPVALTAASTDPNTALSYAATGLPDNVTINPETGVISGTPAAAGSYPAKISVTDSVGNKTEKSLTLLVQTQPAITSPGAGSATMDNTPTLTGTATAGATVTVSYPGLDANAKPTTFTACSQEADSDGMWTCTPTAPIPDGSQTLSVKAVNNGVESVGDPVSFTIVKPDLTVADQAIKLGEQITIMTSTNDPDKVSVVDASKKLVYSASGLPANVTINSETGLISGTPTTAGVSEVTVKVADAYGHESDTKTITITVLAQPTLSLDGRLPGDNAPNLKGTATPGATLTLVDEKGAVVCTVEKVPSDGNWVCQTTMLTNGEHTLTPHAHLNGATAVGAAQTFTIIAPTIVVDPKVIINIGESVELWASCDDPNLPLTYTASGLPAGVTIEKVDIVTDGKKTGEKAKLSGTPTQAGIYPIKVSVQAFYGYTDTKDSIIIVQDRPTVVVPLSDSKTTDNTPSISGSGTPGATIVVKQGNTSVCEATVGPGGSWECAQTSIALPNGEHTLLTTSTLGDKSIVAAETKFQVLAPDLAVSAQTVNLGDQVQVQATSTDPDTPLAYSAVLQGGDKLPAGLNIDAGTGLLSGEPTEAGIYTIMVSVKDHYGNVTTKETTISVQAVPTLNQLANTMSNKPEVSGTGTAGATITVTDESGNSVCTATVQTDGTWKCVPQAPVADGNHTWKASSLLNGVSNAAATAMIFTVIFSDAAVPNATINFGEELAITATSNDPDTPLSFLATGLPPDTSIDNTTGKITGKPSKAGIYQISVTVTDMYGSKAMASAVVTVQDKPNITSPAPDSATMDNKVPISGFGTPGATITVEDQNGKAVCSETVQADGMWSCTPADGLTPGLVTLSATSKFENATTTATKNSFAVLLPDLSVENTTINLGSDLENAATSTDPNGPLAYAVSAQPQLSGLAISSTGMISGKPTQPGVYRLTVTVTDTFHNATSKEMDITVQAIPAVTNSAVTNDNTPLIQGTGTPGAAVVVYEDGSNALCIAAKVNAAGTWECRSYSPLSNGRHNITALSQLNNVISPLGEFVLMDIISPDITLANSLINLGDELNVQAFGQDANGPLSYTAAGLPAGASFDPNTGKITGKPSEVGRYNVTVTVADSYHNKTNASAVLTVQGPPSVLAPDSEQGTTDNLASITGKGIPEATITVTENGDQVCSAQVDKDGQWICTPSKDLADGEHTFTIKSEKDGKISQASSLVLTILPPELFIPDQLVNKGTPLTIMPSAADQNGPLVFSAEQLPDGLSIDPATGKITGTPTSAGKLTAVVTVADKFGNHTTGYVQITVQDNPTFSKPNTPTTANTPTLAGTGTPGASITVTDEQGKTVCVAAVNSNGDWSCVPTSALAKGNHQLTASSKINNQEAAASGALTITVVAPDLTFANQTINLGQAVEYGATSNDPDAPLHYVATGLPDGVSINPETGALTGTPTKAGIYSITVVVSDKNNDQTSATAILTVQMAAAFTEPASGGLTTANKPALKGSGTQGATIIVTDSKNAPVCSTQVQSDGTWSCEPTNPLPDGEQTLIATSAINGVTSDKPAKLNFTITPPSLDAGDHKLELGEELNIVLKASDADKPLAFSATGLPEGASLNPTTGLISGKPVKAGTYIIEITVKDAFSNATKKTITVILTDVTKPEVTPPAAVKFEIGVPIKPLAIPGTDASGKLTYSATGLPTGMNINPDTGEITGVPQELGSKTVTITATDPSGNKTSVTFEMKITDTIAPEVAPIPDRTVKVGSSLTPIELDVSDLACPRAKRPAVAAAQENDHSMPVADTAAAQGVKGCGCATVTMTGLPPGVSFDPTTALVSGNPTATGTFRVTVEVIDESGNKTWKYFTITVLDIEPPTINSGKNGSDLATGPQAPVISGTGEPGAAIEIRDNSGKVVCRTTVKPDGAWTCVPNVQLHDGINIFAIVQIDSNGKESPLLPYTITLQRPVSKAAKLGRTGFPVPAWGILAAVGAGLGGLLLVLRRRRWDGKYGTANEWHRN